MASQIVELSDRLIGAMDRLLASDSGMFEVELPDEAFIGLYREFGSGPIGLDEIRPVIDAIQSIRDAITSTCFGPAPDDLDRMQYDWRALKPRLAGYAAFVAEAKQSRSKGAPGRSPTVGAGSGSAATKPGIAGMTFEKSGRVIEVDGRQFHGVNPLAFKVLEFLKAAEPDPVFKQKLINARLIDKYATDNDINARLPEAFPISVDGTRNGWQLVYKPISHHAEGTCES
jgi:hypothetical protein